MRAYSLYFTSQDTFQMNREVDFCPIFEIQIRDIFFQVFQFLVKADQ